MENINYFFDAFVTSKNMDFFDAYPQGLSHEKHGLFWTPTLEACHMENIDFFDAYPQSDCT